MGGEPQFEQHLDGLRGHKVDKPSKAPTPTGSASKLFKFPGTSSATAEKAEPQKKPT